MVKIIEKQKILVGAFLFALFVGINAFSGVTVSAKGTEISPGGNRIVINHRVTDDTYEYKINNTDHTQKYKITIKALNGGKISGIRMTWDTFSNISPYYYPETTDEIVICRTFPWGLSTLEFILSGNSTAKIEFEKVYPGDKTPTENFFGIGNPIEGMMMNEHIDHYHRFTANFDGTYVIDTTTQFDGSVKISEENGKSEKEFFFNTTSNQPHRIVYGCEKGKSYIVKVSVREGSGGGYKIDVPEIR